MQKRQKNKQSIGGCCFANVGKERLENRKLRSVNSQKEDNNGRKLRILYNENGTHARISDLYPFISGDHSERKNGTVIEHVWQVFIMDRWLQYQPSIGQKLEDLFCYASQANLKPFKKAYKRNWWRESASGDMLTVDYRHYKISPLLMVQRNMKTGRERKIRRQKVRADLMSRELEVISSGHRVQHTRRPRHIKHKRKTYKKHKHKGNSLQRKQDFRSYTHPKVNFRRNGAHHGVFREDVRRSRKRITQDLDSENNYSLVSSGSEDEGLDFENFRKWTTEEVVRWLHVMQLEKFSQFFRNQGITGNDLACEDLPYFVADLDLPLEQSKLIFRALKKLRSGYTNQYEPKSVLSSGTRKHTSPRANIRFSSKKDIYVDQRDAKEYSYSVDDTEDVSFIGTEMSETDEVTNNVEKQGSMGPNYKRSTKEQGEMYPNYVEADKARKYLDVISDRCSYEVSLSEDEHSLKGKRSSCEHLYNMPLSVETVFSVAVTEDEQFGLESGCATEVKKTPLTSPSTSYSNTIPNNDNVQKDGVLTNVQNSKRYKKVWECGTESWQYKKVDRPSKVSLSSLTDGKNRGSLGETSESTISVIETWEKHSSATPKIRGKNQERKNLGVQPVTRTKLESY